MRQFSWCWESCRKLAHAPTCGTGGIGAFKQQMKGMATELISSDLSKLMRHAPPIMIRLSARKSLAGIAERNEMTPKICAWSIQSANRKGCVDMSG